MATLKDVAELSGVTVTTISRMLNNRGKVSGKTKARIQRAMDELGYSPNELARSLTKKTSNFIGLIVPSARNFFFSTVIDSIEHYTSASGYKLLLCVSNMEPKKEIEYFNMLKANKVAGVILASHTQDLLKHVTLDAQIITIDRTISANVPSACSDNYNGGAIAARHLIDRGCRHLAYISGSADIDMDANKRYDGFCSACRESGIDEPDVIDASETSFITMNYSEEIRTLFERHPEIDGILTSNDVIASEVIQYCRINGIAIPEKLRLISYDGTYLASLCSPKLTVIQQPINELCRHCVKSIIQSSQGEVIPTRVVFPVMLVQGEST